MDTVRSAPASGRSLSTEVVVEVAAREGVEPSELDRPLYDAIDPDALDALFAPTNDATGRSGGRVEFTYCGYDVTVERDGRVDVTTARRG